jgi:long-chain acyl-CoA synthetase
MATDTGVDLVDLLTGAGQRFELVRRGPDGTGGLVYRNAPRNLRDVLIEAGRSADDRDYIVYEGRRLSATAHDARCRQLAGYLHDELGVAPGDRVAIAMRNLPEFSIALWAVAVIGAIAVPLNAWLSGSELATALRHSGSSVLVADGERWMRLRPQAAELGLRRALITDADAAVDFASIAADADVLPMSAVFAGPTVDTFPEVDIEPDDAVTIVYTSGTTGSPKGALHTHRNYCSSIMHNLLHREVAHRGHENGGPQASRDGTLLTYPLFHIAGLINLFLSMGERSKVVLMHHWDPVQAGTLIIEEQVTRALLVPTTLRTLLDESGERLAAVPDLALSFIAAGGASVPAELIVRSGELFHDRVIPGNGYGLTETTAGCIAGAGEEYLNNPGSIGRPLPGMEVRIVDVDGSEAPGGVVGEIVVRGPSVCDGYWQNDSETARSFDHGWFHTGDLGRVDENGLYYVVDRIKEVIIRGGENIFCPEVEATLEAHPDVLEAAVFGLPDEKYGEIVGAVVRCRSSSVLDVEQLRAYAREHLAYFKVPERIVITGNDLPRTASGKVLKRDLRALISHGRTQ